MAVLVAAVSLTACTADSPPKTDSAGVTGEPTTGDGVRLVRTGACGDAFFWAETADRTTAVAVSVLYSRPSGPSPTVTIPFSLPHDPVVTVQVLTGQNLSRNFCTDLPATGSEPTTTTSASAGDGQVTIAPPPQDGSGCGRTKGTLSLSGLATDDGRTFDPITVTSTDIGCFAG